MTFRYRRQVLDELATHGVRPTPRTRPELVHEYVNDLYRFELRRLRARHVRGEIARPAYSAHVVELRRKYILVSVPLRLWTFPADAAASGETTAGSEAGEAPG